MGRAHKKHNHAANLNLILNELRKTSRDGGLTLKELCELCGVCKRNIYRYLNEIEEMGFELVRPLQSKPGQIGHGKYRLRRKTLPETSVDTNLMMIMGLNAQRELQYREHLKIINEFFIRYLAAKYCLSLPADWKLPEENEEKQSSALQTCKQTTSTQAVLQNIHCNKNNKELVETAKIIISPTAAESYKRESVPSELVLEEVLSDGSILITLKLNTCKEILPWVFQWSGEAEIVEPKRLRLKMKEYCNSVIKAHRSKYLSRKLSYLHATEIS
ncbi:WYL domain-containing protein [Peptococcaceae bacterium 1198_IL3148]